MKAPRCLPVVALAVLLGSISALLPRVAWAAPSGSDNGASSAPTITIPGPLRSFLRMAGISQKVAPEEVLPLLAFNVFARGYEGWQSSGRPTEFLILLRRYVGQARELVDLAGPEGMIRVSNCEEGRRLLRILGYRLRQDCGDPQASVTTANPERAFLTIDSGFPLPELEQDLQENKPFSYPYTHAEVPVLFTEADWNGLSKEGGHGLLETLMHDPALSRLYWAMSQMDTETRLQLRQSAGLDRFLPYAPVLDFYGSQICIRGGRVVVPGGEAAEAGWSSLVGASPSSAKDFTLHLVSRDRGWLAAYFDAMSRITQAQQAHFTDAHQLKRYYDAFRAPNSSADAARPVFRPAPGLLLLLTRMQWDANGKPHVPGGLDAWKEILRQKTDSKVVRDWGKRASHFNDPDQLLEAMFAFTRVDTDTGPLQIYLTLSELDGRRPANRQLTAKTALLLSSKYSEFSDQYRIFSEFPDLTDESITQFVNIAQTLDKLSDQTLRGNAMGVFEANVGLWQILARQSQIHGDLNHSWQAVIRPFASMPSQTQLFDAGRTSVGEVMRAATGKPNRSQDEIIDLLAGPVQATPDGQHMHQELANSIRSVMDGQRLVSMDTLWALGDGLSEMANGAPANAALPLLAKELRDFEMPRPIFTGTERTEWAAGIYNNHHTDIQMRTDLLKVIKSPSSKGQLVEARGQLAPFLRDTLVGLNYAYYEPPGSQVLRNNPLFVRSHDFAGETVSGDKRVWQAPQLLGEGSPAGGGAHLMGSLADLPYVLAEVEEDFIAPENVQALIWRELVPTLMISATLPRWWVVSHDELHAITLYQRCGEELLTAAARNPEVRDRVLKILADRMNPPRLAHIQGALESDHAVEIMPRVMPADTFYLAAEYRQLFPNDTNSWGPAGQELDSLAHRNPDEVSWNRLSQDFGVPHPILLQSYGRELFNVKPFPAFEGYSSRLLAETWDSSNLYWARLADEGGYPPVMLNRLVPQLTRRMVEKIFATDLEDWPALLRAMRETGEEFQQGKIATLRDGTTGSP